MSDEVKLLPCPFCGDDEELRVDQPPNMYGYWVVHCGCCAGEMQAESEGGAVAGWNTRPPIGTDEVVEGDETSGVSANDPRVCIRLRDALIELRAAVSHHFGAKHPNPAVIEEAMERARAAIAAMKDAASD